MRPEHLNILDKFSALGRVRRRRTAAIALAFVIGAAAGAGSLFGYMQKLESEDDARDLLPQMVASVALHQRMNPMALWDELIKNAGKPYQDFTEKDKARGMRFIGKKMKLPIQRLPVDHALVY